MIEDVDHLELDRPDVVQAVLAAFHRYEQALRDGDVATLTELFWDDDRVSRYGVADRQRGADQLAAWRRAHPTVPPGRRLYDTTVLTVNDRTAVVHTLFDYPGASREGRQSQTWCASPKGGGSSRRTSRRSAARLRHKPHVSGISRTSHAETDVSALFP